MRLPKYKQHEKMGDGDPLKMAGLPVWTPTGKRRRHKYPSDRQVKKRRRDRGDPLNIGFPDERLGLRAFGG